MTSVGELVLEDAAQIKSVGGGTAAETGFLLP